MGTVPTTGIHTDFQTLTQQTKGVVEGTIWGTAGDQESLLMWFGCGRHEPQPQWERGVPRLDLPPSSLLKVLKGWGK